MFGLRRSARVRVASKRVTGLLLLSACTLVQGCSSSNRDGGGGGSSWKLWGNDSARNEQTAANKSAPHETSKQPSSFDNDGPPASPVYRGGRDPVTGRASNEWPPASPAPIQSATLAPLPASPPQYPIQSNPAPSYRPSAPYASAPGAIAASPGGVVEVKHGDTLYRIAKENNVTVPALMQANGLPNETIKLGQRLNIPAR